VIVWDNLKEDDNEFFDNMVGVLAGLFKCGCEMNNSRTPKGTYNIQDYINKQKKGLE
jgi:hypothetical protein